MLSDKVGTSGRFHPEDPAEHARFIEWGNHSWNGNSTVLQQYVDLTAVAEGAEL